MSEARLGQVLEVREPFEALLAFVEEHNRVVHLYASAMNATTGYGVLREALEDIKGPASKNVELIKSAKEFESDCQREIECGFPLLAAHSVVALWSILETTIPEFVRQIIHARPSLAAGASFQKLKIPAQQVLGKSPLEVATVVVEELERSLQSQAKWGMGRFDEILSAVGVAPRCEEGVRRDLFELSQVRNLIAHCRGRVDRKFSGACPWLPWDLGEPVPLKLEDHDRYTNAVCRYSAAVLREIV